MSADVSVPNNFVAGTPSVADDVDANFAALVSWINTNAVHLDASKAFTSIPSGPASDPSSDNQFTRKAYVDAKADTRCGGSWTQTSDSFISGDSYVTFETEVEDTDGFWSSGNTVTVPTGKGGVYAVTAWFQGPPGWFANTSYRAYIEIGGILYSVAATAGSSGQDASGSVVLPIAAGGTIKLRIIQTTGSSQTFSTKLYVYRVSL